MILWSTQLQCEFHSPALVEAATCGSLQDKPVKWVGVQPHAALTWPTLGHLASNSLKSLWTSPWADFGWHYWDGPSGSLWTDTLLLIFFCKNILADIQWENNWAFSTITDVFKMSLLLGVLQYTKFNFNSVWDQNVMFLKQHLQCNLY